MTIFDYAQEYKDIVSILEENDGELTDELEERLKINHNEVESKLKGYKAIIRMNESYIDAIKEEIQELNNKIGTYTNINKRLKDVCLYAVKEFGEDGKSGNKVIDFADFKAYTRKVEVLDYDAEEQKNYELDIANKLQSNDMLFANTNDNFVKTILYVKPSVAKSIINLDDYPIDKIEVKVNRTDLLKEIKANKDFQFESAKTKESETVIFK